MPNTPYASRGGLRQQRAAALRAELERRQSEAEQVATTPAQEADDAARSTSADDLDEQAVEAERAEAAETGPVGTGEYLVKGNDCMASISKNTGHFWETIWKDAANSELREKRKDPWVLLPGDRLHIPELRRKEEPGGTEQRHRFRRIGEPHDLRIQILDDDEPRANEPYSLEIDGTIYNGTLDEQGILDVPIPGSARRGVLRVGHTQDEYPLMLGGVDPISETTGVQERLNNLGFGCGAVDGLLGDRTRAALKRFQKKHKLPETGELDQATRTRLKEAHGS